MRSSAPVPLATGLVVGPGGWSLAPEGAIIHEREKTAVVADVHLGYEWSRGGGGDVVPAHSLAETIARLGRLLDRASVARLVVAGDLVESPRPCRRTEANVARLQEWLDERGVELVPIRGNHDRPGRPLAIDVAGWTIAHGHQPVCGAKTITGHDHPVLRAGRVVARCLLVGPSAIVLPAFTENAAGLDIARAARWKGRGLRCWADAGARLLDFGPVDDLATRLGAYHGR
jgi:hypothetical protein